MAKPVQTPEDLLLDLCCVFPLKIVAVGSFRLDRDGGVQDKLSSPTVFTN